jgi:hypothetical protein
MMRNRKVWGVLGLLLALVVVVGYGQPQPLQPQPDPVAKLAAYPQELTSVLSQVVRQFTRVLGETQINISNAVMWIGRRDPVVIDSGVIIIAPPARLDLRPGAIVGLIGVHNVPLGTPALRTGYYTAKLPPDLVLSPGAKSRLILVDQTGREVGVASIQLPQVPQELEKLSATPPRVHMSMGLQDPVPPNYPGLNLVICIGWKRANCDCIGIAIY